MIYDDSRCLLGEGPLWHPTRKELFWFDILGKRLHRKGQSWSFDRHVSAAGWLSDKELLIADDRSLSRFHIDSGKKQSVVALEPDNPVTRSNDGRADPWGGFWIGTMGLNAQPEAGAIYRYFRGEVRQLYPDITIPNAICFTPDGGHAHFADTATGKVYRQRLSEADGWPVGSPELWLDFEGTGLNPDGAVIDAAGQFWNAQWGASRVACYGPEGTFVTAMTFAAVQTSCPAFGGPGLGTLFCTSAAEGLDEDDPNQGRTYCAQIDATGLPEHQVIL